MHLINIKLILFDNFNDVKSEPLTVSNILKVFSESEIKAMPNVFQAISANPNGMLKKEERMSFVDNYNKISLAVPTDSIQIEKEYSIPNFENLDTKLGEFTKDAFHILSAFLKGASHEVNATRLSIITNVMIDQKQISDIAKVYEVFNQKFDGYDSDLTFEWSNRAVKKIDASSIQEELNDVTEILRVQGLLNQNDTTVEIDTIQIRLDLNTLPMNSARRFDLDAIKLFSEEVSNLAFSKINHLGGIIL